MKIYELSSDPDKYYPIKFCNDEDTKKLKLFNGKQYLQSAWVSISVEYLINDEDNKLWPDAPYLSPGVPVVNRKAHDSLIDLLKGKVEILPLNCRGNDLYALNVVNMIDGLDTDKSEFKRYSSGKIMWCTRYVFKTENVIYEDIFKVDVFPNGLIFVSEKFMNKVLESGLHGFKFIKVWDSNV